MSEENMQYEKEDNQKERTKNISEAISKLSQNIVNDVVEKNFEPFSELCEQKFINDQFMMEKTESWKYLFMISMVFSLKGLEESLSGIENTKDFLARVNDLQEKFGDDSRPFFEIFLFHSKELLETLNE